MMNLHKFIPDKELPAALKSKLVFGDSGQISALKTLELRIMDIETKKAKEAAGELEYYEVSVDFHGAQTFKILAVDSDDAEEKAGEMADKGNIDFSLEFLAIKIRRN